METEKLTYEQLQQMLVEEYNQQTGELNKIDKVECSICKNKGYIHYLRPDGMIAKECTCMRKRRAIRRALASGVGDYINRTLDDYNAVEEWQIKCKQKALEYLKANDNSWFLALGQSGSGKTLLCSIIASELMLNYERTVLCVTWTDFISRLKRDMMSDNAKAVSNYLDSIKNCDVLFLDELLKKYNDTDLRYLIEIINYRYANNKKTIITSEQMINDLLDIEEATFSRAIERSGKFILSIKKDRARNYRLFGCEKNGE